MWGTRASTMHWVLKLVLVWVTSPSSQSSQVSCRSSTFYKCGNGSSSLLGSCCRLRFHLKSEWFKSLCSSHDGTQKNIELSTHRVFKEMLLQSVQGRYRSTTGREQRTGPRPLAQWHPGHSPISWEPSPPVLAGIAVMSFMLAWKPFDLVHLLLHHQRLTAEA